MLNILDGNFLYYFDPLKMGIQISEIQAIDTRIKQICSSHCDGNATCKKMDFPENDTNYNDFGALSPNFFQRHNHQSETFLSSKELDLTSIVKVMSPIICNTSMHCLNDTGRDISPPEKNDNEDSSESDSNFSPIELTSCGQLRYYKLPNSQIKPSTPRVQNHFEKCFYASIMDGSAQKSQQRQLHMDDPQLAYNECIYDAYVSIIAPEGKCINKLEDDRSEHLKGEEILYPNNFDKSSDGQHRVRPEELELYDGPNEDEFNQSIKISESSHDHDSMSSLHLGKDSSRSEPCQILPLPAIRNVSLTRLGKVNNNYDTHSVKSIPKHVNIDDQNPICFPITGGDNIYFKKAEEKAVYTGSSLPKENETKRVRYETKHFRGVRTQLMLTKKVNSGILYADSREYGSSISSGNFQSCNSDESDEIPRIESSMDEGISVNLSYHSGLQSWLHSKVII